jgi:hypothetical protein
MNVHYSIPPQIFQVQTIFLQGLCSPKLLTVVRELPYSRRQVTNDGEINVRITSNVHVLERRRYYNQARLMNADVQKHSFCLVSDIWLQL